MHACPIFVGMPTTPTIADLLDTILDDLSFFDDESAEEREVADAVAAKVRQIAAMLGVELPGDSVCSDPIPMEGSNV